MQQPAQPTQRPPRNTPRKGRPRRDSTQTPRNPRPAKNYASENDIPRDSTGFRTQRRATPNMQLNNNNNTNNSVFHGNSSNTSQKNRNKGRPISIATNGTPMPSSQYGHTSPPLTASKSTAFAGATYHSSPAPATLPIPSFMLKALDFPSHPKSVNIGQELSPPMSDSESSSPTQSSRVKGQERRPVEESPLDFFFKKDREEKERVARSNSIPGLIASTPSPINAQSHAIYAQANYSAPMFGGPAPAPRTFIARNTLPRISPEELDGVSGRLALGPAFSTPFRQRMNAATNGGFAQGVAQSPTDRTETLKALLSIGAPTKTGNDTLAPSSFCSPSHDLAVGYVHRSLPLAHQHIQSPTRPSFAINGQANGVSDAAALTNSLKNLLRIQ